MKWRVCKITVLNSLSLSCELFSSNIMCFACNFFVKSVLPTHLSVVSLPEQSTVTPSSFCAATHSATGHTVNQLQQHPPTRSQPMSHSPKSQEHLSNPATTLQYPLWCGIKKLWSWVDPRHGQQLNCRKCIFRQFWWCGWCRQLCSRWILYSSIDYALLGGQKIDNRSRENVDNCLMWIILVQL